MGCSSSSAGFFVANQEEWEAGATLTNEELIKLEKALLSQFPHFAGASEECPETTS